jgi:hypothetical protein
MLRVGDELRLFTEIKTVTQVSSGTLVVATPFTGSYREGAKVMKVTGCSAGYHWSNTFCTANTCSCSDGTAATGASCITDGAAICTGCVVGYGLSGISCVATTTTTTEAQGRFLIVMYQAEDKKNQDKQH